ncbi:MAG TPA: GntR family transcriptional regulator [Steroidobacteraceae bacterium]
MTEPLVRSVTSQLIERVRVRILAGAYAPGAALRQDALAAEFGTSKIPVREALVRLQSEGLVNIFPNRGFQVRPLAASELDEIFNLRLLMEPAAAASGAKLATPADQKAAAEALRRLNTAMQAAAHESTGQLNRDFHLQLLVPRLQPIAAEILGRLHTLAQRYVQIHLQPAGRTQRALREHGALLELWCARRTARLRELLYAHIETTRDDLARAVGGPQVQRRTAAGKPSAPGRPHRSAPVRGRA